ncbi:hypothetical protein BKA62DRAFT_758152 [Auriculariales sp. MPI-PUGE-AT-0066]|nr:hypothetical protein BKA62DRAFT_758152 [Auriculariales sp. MPI-PUGE-AT-0066]
MDMSTSLPSFRDIFPEFVVSRPSLPHSRPSSSLSMHSSTTSFHSWNSHIDSETPYYPSSRRSTSSWSAAEAGAPAARHSLQRASTVHYPPSSSATNMLQHSHSQTVPSQFEPQAIDSASVSSGSKRFVCPTPLCGLTYSCIGNLNRHRSKAHGVPLVPRMKKDRLRPYPSSRASASDDDF